MAAEPDFNPFASPTSTGDAIAPTGSTIDVLVRTRPWVLVIASMGSIALVFGVLALIFSLIGAIVSINEGPEATGQAFGGFFMALLMTVLYGYPVVCLFRYAGRIKQLARSGSASDLTSALDAQRAFWKFGAIMAIIIMAIYALVFLFFGLSMLAQMPR